MISDHKDEVRSAFFVDPPYTACGKKAGRRLYAHNHVDHNGLFDLMDSVRGDLLMTYDDAAGVRDLAESHGFNAVTVAMSNTHHAKMQELLISKDMTWAK